MNKRILLLFTIVSLFCSAAHSMDRGDINNNGIIDVDDLNALISIILSDKTPSNFPGNADLDGNGNINVDDVNIIINIILGKEIEKETFTVNGVSFRMVPVEGGTFTMGGTEEQGSDAESDEFPTHQVTLSSYSIGQTEVTQALWLAVMGSNPSSCNAGFYGTNLQRPVESVSWDDCQQFIAKLNQLTGKYFRLPTEAEWEFATRGGNKSRGYKFPGGSNLDDVAWYSDNSGSTTHTVGTKQPNELGLYDMSGNVSEWCQDWYGSYSSDAQTNPTGPAAGTYRVNSDGCWFSIPRDCRVSNRTGCLPSQRSSGLGLRLVL